MNEEEPKELVAKNIEMADDLKLFQKFDEKGLISIKTLVLKNPDSRSKSEEMFLVLFLKIKHSEIF